MSRRSPPVVALDRSVARSRLVPRLAQRFSHRVVTVTAHAGSGKTTALALAMEANRIDELGHDVWLALDRRDDDPERLLAGIADALGAPSVQERRLEAIVDAVWSIAPDDVALILDDVHVLQSPASLGALTELIHQLPGNGHLVLSSRTRLDLPLARLRAQFQVVDIGSDDLSFDDAELAALAELRGADSSEASAAPALEDLPRVAALADLTLRYGAGAGAEFLWDEVLAAFSTDQLDALRRLALIGDVDEQLADEVVRSAGATLELDGLPLLDRSSDGGRLVMHDLLRSALLESVDGDERVRLAGSAAADALRSGDRSLATALYVDAGDLAGAVEAARAFIMTASLRRTLEQIKRVSTAIDRVDPTSPLARFLRAELRSGESDTSHATGSQAVEFGEVADAARQLGDDAVEAAACYRCHQQTLLELLPVASGRIDRLAELAPGLPYAAQVLRFARASQHLRNGDSVAAWAEIVDLDDIADVQSEQIFRAGLMCLLGRFDDVVDEFAASDSGTLAPGVGEYVSYAIYLSGSMNPEVAATTIDEDLSAFARAQLAQTSVVLFTTGALIAVHVGDHERAADHLATARRVASSGCVPSFAVNVDTAASVLALVTAGEDAARGVLEESFDRVRLGRWPTAAHLTVLPVIYLLFPSLRERLDQCEFGRPAAIAVAAELALVAAREHGDLEPALALPWGEPDLLRVQVPPPLLAELAALGAAAHSAEAAALLDVVPHADRWLRRAARGTSETAVKVSAVLSTRPRVPEIPLHVATLGPLVVERGGDVVDHPDLSRRGRVQQLLGLLAERRSIGRGEASELLWPDLESRAAANNLRVTLAYLHRALEPERTAEELPIYVTQRSEILALHAEVTTDVESFHAAVRSGQSHARRRAPRSAIAAYRKAAEIYRGDFFAGHDAEWLVGARERARFDALHTFVRLGELTLASGEPEEASMWALRARELSPSHERAERLLASCQLATGDRAGAVGTLRRLVAALCDDGIAPEIETSRMLERLTL